MVLNVDLEYACLAPCLLWLNYRYKTLFKITASNIPLGDQLRRHRHCTLLPTFHISALLTTALTSFITSATNLTHSRKHYGTILTAMTNHTYCALLLKLTPAFPSTSGFDLGQLISHVCQCSWYYQTNPF